VAVVLLVVFQMVHVDALDLSVLVVEQFVGMANLIFVLVHQVVKFKLL
jgi:hypothetical protein